MKLKILLITIVAVIAGGIWFHYANEKSAWNATFEWTGISALPTWANNKKLEVRGNMFTRTFIVIFDGTSEQIIDWLKTEPALQNIKPEQMSKAGQVLHQMSIEGYSNEAQKNFEDAEMNETLQEIKDSKAYKYILEPQGGSAYDEVWIDLLNNKVTIKAEWS